MIYIYNTSGPIPAENVKLKQIRNVHSRP